MKGESFDLLMLHPMLTLFGLIALGLAFGNITIYGVSLGSSGVIFIALLVGHLGGQIPEGIGNMGLILFVYCVGIGAGGRFFGSLRQEGRRLAILSIVVILSGGTCAYFFGKWLDLDAAMTAGIFAGALTSTPALAAAIEGTQGLAANVVVGYGVAYPFGVIGVVLFVQVLPRLLKLNLEESGEDDVEKKMHITRQLVDVRNQNLFGKRLFDTSVVEIEGCLISRVKKDQKLIPVSSDEVLEEGKIFLMVGEPKAIKIATELIGRKCDEEIPIDADHERRRMVVTNKALFGKDLRTLDFLRNHGVVVTRLNRMEFTFVPRGDTILENRDILTVVGPEYRLKKFEKYIGHRSQAFSETSLISLMVGLSLGVLLGKMKIPLVGGESFSLGLAGGPLLVALTLGHFGKLSGVVGYIPRPTRVLLQEMGLVFFLAEAGIKGGASLAEAISAHGMDIFLMGGAVTLVPLIVGYGVATRLLGMKVIQGLGGICGSMTSTPALGAITNKTSNQLPVLSYATVYPIAVILMVLLARLLMHLYACF